MIQDEFDQFMDSLVAPQQQQAGFNGTQSYPTFTDQDFDFAVDFDPFNSPELSQSQGSLLNLQDDYFGSSFSGSLSTPSTSIPTSPVSCKPASSTTKSNQEELLSQLKQAMEGTNLQMPAAISSSSDLSSSSVPVPKIKSRQRGAMSCCRCRKLKKKCEKVENKKDCLDCLRKGIECSWPENPGNINRRKSKGNIKKVSGSKDKTNV